MEGIKNKDCQTENGLVNVVNITIEIGTLRLILNVKA